MTRIYHPYTKWEEVRFGMWRKLERHQEEDFFNKAVDFTGNAELYGSFMLKVLQQWPISCEQNLSAGGMNRRAWIGHAAACIAFECPEYITRLAWGYLNKQQQDSANAQADIAIKLWESDYKGQSKHNGYICQNTDLE